MSSSQVFADAWAGTWDKPVGKEKSLVRLLAEPQGNTWPKIWPKRMLLREMPFWLAFKSLAWTKPPHRNVLSASHFHIPQGGSWEHEHDVGITIVSVWVHYYEHAYMSIHRYMYLYMHVPTSLHACRYDIAWLNMGILTYMPQSRSKYYF